MNKFKLLLVLSLYFFISCQVLVTAQSKRLTEKDLNADIIVSIEGYSIPEQFFQRGMGDTKLSPVRYPNFGAKPVDALQGSTLKIKVEFVDNDGIRKDISNSKDVHVRSTFYMAHFCGDMKLCVWPELEKSDSRYDLRFGVAMITATYISANGKLKTYNGFNLNILPDPKFNQNNLPPGSVIDKNTPIKPSTLKTQPITEQTWQQIKKLKGIATQSGMATPSLYVFFDPNCPYCTDLWKTLLPAKPGMGVKSAEVQKAEFFNSVTAVWIPVAYMNDTSLGKSAALLRANSQSAIDNNFQTAKRKEKQGGAITVVPTETEKTALAQSKAVWLELGGATPLMVYRNKAGSTQLFMGVPSDDQLTELLGQIGASSLSAYPTK
jgi:hypothetical protein